MSKKDRPTTDGGEGGREEGHVPRTSNTRGSSLARERMWPISSALILREPESLPMSRTLLTRTTVWNTPEVEP